MITSQITKAVIPAAGLGTRFLPASKVVAKELMPIVDRPSIQYIVEEALEAGLTEIIFVLSRDKSKILEYFEDNPTLNHFLSDRGKLHLLDDLKKFQKHCRFQVVYQDKPLGLGHAVSCAKEAIGNEWFFVFLPDDLIDNSPSCAQQMLEAWKTYQGAMVAVMEVPWEEVKHYGVVKAQPISSFVGKVETVVEKPKREEAPSNLAIIGRYLLPPEILPLLAQVGIGALGEIQLTDGLLKLAKNKGMYALQFEGERYDVGNKLGFVEANLAYALKREEMKKEVLDIISLLATSR
ncbi:MAG: hypothetical protein A3G32_06575 [Deltaproteobacteria bacterium RIFCSPLOWO2_12_FULL_40_28]|nr:MAG: hypothetical protein A3C45_02670 [Deltaproteobacteria bacterium RIFCSPHIGHO2_02_FULL_40_28]OGQ19112.1 MAG: hypothetical protein A3E27_05760 [Deltaproteobacteria bacterium RIFCSPHIGHO2_12_FULL_40_32]OGQ40284.1 MAG: hypothetical protein A3I69_01200 [Deltaproteobacteria bacterium RIFCSPLOWO2_02_FULL_40_36]OGQ53555.1 MAG: hypothetical protein A3G32_06575 [Deltaproteobacteria bacterium RIFCSPLOWO2_12_FULL_40_28]